MENQNPERKEKIKLLLDLFLAAAFDPSEEDLEQLLEQYSLAISNV